MKETDGMKLFEKKTQLEEILTPYGDVSHRTCGLNDGSHHLQRATPESSFLYTADSIKDLASW